MTHPSFLFASFYDTPELFDTRCRRDISIKMSCAIVILLLGIVTSVYVYCESISNEQYIADPRSGCRDFN